MPIFIDLIMMGLLVGVIIHSTQLSKSLKEFKKIHSEIVPLMRDYSQTVQTSFQQIEAMKKISVEFDDVMKLRLPEALKIQKDLEFLVGRSEELADHLELIIRTGRDQEFMTLRTDVKNQKDNLRDNGMNNISEVNEDAKKEDSTLKTSKKEKVKLSAQRDLLPSEIKETDQKKVTRKSRVKASFKPIVDSFFLTKTAKRLLGKDHLSDREKHHAA